MEHDQLKARNENLEKMINLLEDSMKSKLATHWNKIKNSLDLIIL